MSMKPEIKTAWIEALRSGKYNQGFSALNGSDLNNKPGFCCLGVLCEIQSDEIKKEYNIHYSDGTMWEKDRLALVCDDSVETLSKNFREFVAISEKKMKILYQMNDDGGNFSEIADWIEKNL